jgi:hypothetical protein
MIFLALFILGLVIGLNRKSETYTFLGNKIISFLVGKGIYNVNLCNIPINCELKIHVMVNGLNGEWVLNKNPLVIIERNGMQYILPPLLNSGTKQVKLVLTRKSVNSNETDKSFECIVDSNDKNIFGNWFDSNVTSLVKKLK